MFYLKKKEFIMKSLEKKKNDSPKFYESLTENFIKQCSLALKNLKIYFQVKL